MNGKNRILMLLLASIFLALAPSACATVDTFEAGNINNWSVVAPYSLGGTFTASTDADKFGVYGGRMTTDGAADNEHLIYENTDASGNTGNFYTWVRTTNAGSSIYGTIYQVVAGGDTGIGIWDDKVYIKNPGWNELVGVTPLDDTWYRFRMDLDTTSNSADFYVYDTSDSLIVSSLGQTTEAMGAIQKVWLRVKDGDGAPYSVDWDNTALTDTIEVIPNDTPDANIWQVDGYDLNTVLPRFAYSVDGNLTITFAAGDKDDDDLNFSIWYDTTHEGKSYMLATDINLSTNPGEGSCDTNNKAGMVCSYDWAIETITDGNYWVTIEVNDGTDSNNVSTERSFKVNYDAEDPVVGNIVLDGFIFGGAAGNFIDGEGTVYALITDNNGVISCQYNIGGGWIGGTWDGSYCVSPTITIVNAQEYSFNIRGFDTIGNFGDGSVRNFTGKTTLADLENIEDADLAAAGLNMGYNILLAIAAMAGLFLIIMLFMAGVNALITR